jgi:hypothetical protein
MNKVRWIDNLVHHLWFCDALSNVFELECAEDVVGYEEGVAGVEPDGIGAEEGPVESWNNVCG